MIRRRQIMLRGALLLAGGWFCPVRADESFWHQLAVGGCAVLLRHARTVPGFGDPPGYRLDDCSTQRNLSEAGRAEARLFGAGFAQRGARAGTLTLRGQGLDQAAQRPFQLLISTGTLRAYPCFHPP